MPVHTQVRRRPITLQALASRAGLQQRNIFKQAQTGFLVEQNHVYILPDSSSITALELIKFGRWRGNHAFDNNQFSGRGHLRKLGTVIEIAGSPASLHQNYLSCTFNRKGRDNPETYAAAHWAIVQVDRVR